jgi:hypothetical protein
MLKKWSEPGSFTGAVFTQTTRSTSHPFQYVLLVRSRCTESAAEEYNKLNTEHTLGSIAVEALCVPVKIWLRGLAYVLAIIQGTCRILRFSDIWNAMCYTSLRFYTCHCVRVKGPEACGRTGWC